jgi:hypothetical protein
MGGTIQLVPAKGHTKTIREWHNLLRLERGQHTIVPPRDEKLEKLFDGSVWFRGLYCELKSSRYDMSYAIWDQPGSAFGTQIGREMVRRGWVKKAGWDSIGYCKTLDEFLEGEPFSYDVDLEKRMYDYDTRLAQRDEIIDQYYEGFKGGTFGEDDEDREYKDYSRSEVVKMVDKSLADLKKAQPRHRERLALYEHASSVFKAAAVRIVEAKSFDDAKPFLLGEGSPENFAFAQQAVKRQNERIKKRMAK